MYVFSSSIFYGLKYLQHEAPEIKKKLKAEIIREIAVKF